jgi:hypothetical protein
MEYFSVPSTTELVTEYEVFKTFSMFLFSNYRRVLKVVFFLLGDSPASEFYVLTFRNTLSVPSSWAAYTAYQDQTKCSETSAHKIQTPWNHPKERITRSSLLLLHLMKRFVGWTSNVLSAANVSLSVCDGV